MERIHRRQPQNTQRRQAGTKIQDKCVQEKWIQGKSGTTLVETMVTLLLISIMMTMTAASLSAASRIFVRVQKTQYAQSILDTAMTELRNVTQNAVGYVKVYQTGETITDAEGAETGTALEFLNTEGYVVLVSTDGCEDTKIYIGDKSTGTAAAVEKGQLLTRYYFRNSNTKKYTYLQTGNVPVARAVAAVFAKGFYMGNQIEVEYTVPTDKIRDGKLNSITAKVTLYSDENHTNVVATDSETLEFRRPMAYRTQVTATTEQQTAEDPAESTD